MLPEEFAEIKNVIRYDFIQDNYFNELKEAEITRERLTTLREVEEHVGTYYSRDWVRKNVLGMSEDEIKEMEKEIDKEKKAEAEAEMEAEPQQGYDPNQEFQPDQEESNSNTING